jgi:hypothetical protein
MPTYPFWCAHDYVLSMNCLSRVSQAWRSVSRASLPYHVPSDHVAIIIGVAATSASFCLYMGH